MTTDMREENIVDASGDIASGVGRFEVLLEKSRIFVDKSLFISAFINNINEAILTTYPRRSGKSMNMRMLQSFFRIEVDEKGKPIPEEERKYPKYFIGGEVDLDAGEKKVLHHLKISCDPRAMKLQGQIPVIYIDMKECSGISLDETVSSIKPHLQECFSDHKYLKYSDRLDEEDKKRFKEYTGSISHRNLTDEDVVGGIKFLSKLLKEHFGKEVIILIDEYDAAINKAYNCMSDDEFKKVVDLFRKIYGSALKNNDNLRKALVTGVTRIAKANIFSGLNNFGEYNICNRTFAPYYGFTQEEVDELIKHYDMPDGMSGDIKSWYNGYRVGEYSIYNTWSIIKCINNYLEIKDDKEYSKKPELLKKDVLQSYWEASGNVDFIKGAFEKDSIKKRIDRLVSGSTISLELHQSITSDDFAVLKKLSNLPSNYTITEAGSDILFSYLMMGGYLTFSDDTKRKFKLPNHEIRHEFQRRLCSYYHGRYGIPRESFEDVTDALDNVLSSVNEEGYRSYLLHFQEVFGILLTNLPQFKNITDDSLSDRANVNKVHGNEDLAHCLLSYIALQLQFVDLFGTELCLGEGRADIAFINRKLGVGSIIEIKYTKDSSKCEQMALEGLDQIENKKYAEEMKKYYDVVLLGIGISEEKSVAVRDKVIRLGKDLEELERSRLLDFDLT